MDLAIDASEAASRVVIGGAIHELSAPPLQYRAKNCNRMVIRRAGKLGEHARAQFVGVVAGVFQVVAGRPKLGQDDQLRVALGRFGDHALGGFKVVFDAGELDMHLTQADG